jgi:hypothetical protein
MKPFQLFSKHFLASGLVFFLTVSAPASDAQMVGSLQNEYEGTLGKMRIGLTVVYEGGKIEAGHYFYQKFLEDIPIVGFTQGPQITLTGSGGETFHLHFVGNGSEGDQTLDFQNSIGMDGVWTSAEGRRSYPVSLHQTTGRNGADDGHRYSDITTESDAAFERRVQSLLRAVQSGAKGKTVAVRFISYPLKVNYPSGRGKKFRNSAEVLAGWDDIFTPAMLARLRQDLPHDMFVHNGMAMLGNGEAWFNARGLATVNVPSPSESHVSEKRNSR